MATATRLGQAGLQGWREKAADGIAEPVARRAPLDSEQVRALLGAVFFVLSVLYVVKTVAARPARCGRAERVPGGRCLFGAGSSPLAVFG
jgi:hypothetical protein